LKSTRDRAFCGGPGFAQELEKERFSKSFTKKKKHDEFLAVKSIRKNCRSL
jgi:hypothetical protein